MRSASLVLMVLAPLAWVPGGYSRSTLATLLVVAVGLLVAVAVPRTAVLPRSLVLVGWVAAAGFVVAALLDGTPEASLVGRWPRYEGLPTLLLYAGAAWAGARLLGREGAEGRDWLVWPLAGAAVLLAVASVLDVAGVTVLGMGGGPGRDGSLAGNATDQGAIALMTVLVLAPAAVSGRGSGRESGRSRVVAGVGAVAGLVTVAASGSRTALALTLVGLVVLGTVALRRRGGPAFPAALAVAVGGPLVLVAAALGVPTTRGRLLGTATGEARLHQWRLTARMLVDHPVLGVGPSRYVDAFGRYEDLSFVRFTGPYTLADSPHSVVLQVLCAGGVVLGIVVAVAAVLTARRVVAVVRASPDAWGPALAVTAYVVLLLVNFTSAGPTCLAALLLGSVVAVAAPTDAAAGSGHRAEPVALRAATAAGATALAVVLVGACVADVRLRQGLDAAPDDRTAAAVADLDSARAWRPWDSDVGMLGAQALAALSADERRPAAAVACLDLASFSLAHTRDNATTLVAQGVCLVARGEPNAAAASFDAAVAAAPTRPDGYVQRAIVRYAEHDVVGARSDLARAREIAPHAAAVRRLARLLDRTDR